MFEERIIHNPYNGKTHVMLNRDDIRKCVKLSGDFSKYEQWGGNDSSRLDNRDNYGAGIWNTSKDKYKTERLGLFGEVAFSTLSGLPLDEEIRTGGNSWDFIAHVKRDITLDVKNTASFKKRPDKYGEFMIKNSTWEHGPKRFYPLKAYGYFFTSNCAFLNDSNNKFWEFKGEVTKIIMRMHGAISANKIENNREERAGSSPVENAKWDNIYVNDLELMRSLDFFKKIGLEVPSFLPYEDCINGLWKGLKRYV